MKPKNLAKEYLLDASTFVSAYLEDNLKLRNWLDAQPRLFYIDLLKSEAANVAITKGLLPQAYQEFLEVLDEEKYQHLPYTPIDYYSAYNIALECETALYDAIYHAAALKLYLTFLTMDRKYYEKAKHIGYIELAPGA